VIPALLPPLLLVLPGFLTARRLVPDSNAVERLGLSILFGIGGGTTLLFALAAAGIHLTAAIAFGALAVATGILAAVTAPRRSGRPATATVDRAPDSPPAAGAAHQEKPRSPAWTPAEILAAALIAGLVLVSAAKGWLYPVTALDAHAYDGRARWIVAEGRLDLSIYRELHVPGTNNLTYPPLFPLSLALGYWAGGGQGKTIDTFFFAAILLVVGGVLARRLPRLGALLGALLLAATPEVWNHASLALTNLPAMAFLASGALVALLPGASAPAAGLLLAFAAGVRSDAAVVAVAVALAVSLLQPGRRPAARLRTAAWLAVPPLLMSVAWQIFLHARLGVTSDSPFRRSLLPDPGMVMEVTRSLVRVMGAVSLYGWTFYLLVGLLGVTFLVRLRRRPGDPPDERGLFLRHAAVGGAVAIALVAIFQQLHPDHGGGLREMLGTSFKRDLFHLVPLAIVTTLLSPVTRRALAALDRWQRR
jgi:hypothetical protein